MKKIRFTGLLVLAILALASCKKNDDDNGPVTPETGPSSFKISIENVGMHYDFSSSGVFNTPVGASSPAPVFPGEKYEVMFKAGIGSKLSFVTMFVQSNDLFYAPDGMGIELFENRVPVTGDITDQLYLWDAGTELNEKPGEGMYQAPRQSGPDMGTDESCNVRMIESANDGYTYPMASEVIKVYLDTMSTGMEFKLTIENVSTSNTLMTSSGSFAVPLSPGVFVVHSGKDPLFKAGESDYGMGLEDIAEDGDPSMLYEYILSKTGLNVLLSPGVWTLTKTGTMPLFEDGMMDFGDGLEGIAEDGSPADLEMSLMMKPEIQDFGVFNTVVGASSPSPAHPGQKYEFMVDAEPGYYLSFASMFAQSNDLFYAFGDMGIPLFSGEMPVNGDYTSSVYLWDAGTEVNEEPGIGSYQAPRQPMANSGMKESGNVVMVNDGFTYPSVSSAIKVTIMPIP